MGGWVTVRVTLYTVLHSAARVLHGLPALIPGRFSTGCNYVRVTARGMLAFNYPSEIGSSHNRAAHSRRNCFPSDLGQHACTDQSLKLAQSQAQGGSSGQPTAVLRFAGFAPAK